METLSTSSVPGPVEVRVRLPCGYDPQRADRYPLLLLLHGGGGSSLDLDMLEPAIERAMRDSSIPPTVIAMPSARRSLYMDYRNGSQRWESFIIHELLPFLRERYHVATGREGTMVSGWSMGGAGSLRLAFKHPDIFRAVAGLEPAIEPATRWRDVVTLDKYYRPSEMVRSIFGNPVDAEFWAENNPATLASRYPDRLTRLGIYLEVGDKDALLLYRGTEFLHRILFDRGIAHEYRLVRGADHVGPSLLPRFYDALAFLGRQLVPPKWDDPEVLAFHQWTGSLQRSAGLHTDRSDPGKIPNSRFSKYPAQ